MTHLWMMVSNQEVVTNPDLTTECYVILKNREREHAKGRELNQRQSAICNGWRLVLDDRKH